MFYISFYISRYHFYNFLEFHSTLSGKDFRPKFSFFYKFYFSKINLKNDYCLLLMIWLLNSQEMKNCKSTESFCRSILAIYTNHWSNFWYVYCCYVYFFSGKFRNVCNPRTTYSHWQPGPPGLAFCGSGLACLPSWLEMVKAGWLRSMQSETFLQMKFIIFQGCPTKQNAFLFGQPSSYNQLPIQPL